MIILSLVTICTISSHPHIVTRVPTRRRSGWVADDRARCAAPVAPGCRHRWKEEDAHREGRDARERRGHEREHHGQRGAAPPMPRRSPARGTTPCCGPHTARRFRARRPRRSRRNDQASSSPRGAPSRDSSSRHSRDTAGEEKARASIGGRRRSESLQAVFQTKSKRDAFAPAAPFATG